MQVNLLSSRRMSGEMEPLSECQTQQFIIVSNQSSDGILRQSEKLQIKDYLSLLCLGVCGFGSCNVFHESEAKVQFVSFFLFGSFIGLFQA